MLTPDDERTDGRKITYLTHADKWRSHDPALFDLLAITIKTKARDIRHTKRVLDGAVFFNEIVPDDASAREKWLTRAFRKLTTVDLLFFDPDNGIEIRSRPKGSRDSNKYLFWDEIEAAWSNQQSLLIFQHFPRANHEQFASRLSAECRERLRTSAVVPLMTSNVLFLLVSQSVHQSRIDSALRAIAATWADRINPFSTPTIEEKRWPS